MERGPVDQRNPPVGIESDNACAHARQHRLREAPAFVELLIGGDEFVALLLELSSHAIECAGECREIARSLDHRHLGIEIAARHFARRVEQADDRRDEAIGEPQAEPHRGEQEDQRHAGIHQCKGDLHADALLEELVIFGLGRAGLRQAGSSTDGLSVR